MTQLPPRTANLRSALALRSRSNSQHPAQPEDERSLELADFVLGSAPEWMDDFDRTMRTTRLQGSFRDRCGVV